MSFAGISYVAVLAAAVVAFAFGAAWHGILGKRWMAAVRMTEQPKQTPAPFIIAFAYQAVMAWVLAGVIGHMGDVTLTNSLITAAFVWGGFVLTTMLINHRFQGAT
tara:strand:- start:1381 stop:1698 length:318 start_codon:yes stop_codon:yes gene_type:complete